LLIEALLLRTEEQANDQVFRPDRRLRSVRPGRHVGPEPSRANRRLIGPANKIQKASPMTKIYSLLAAALAFAPVALATMAQAAQIVA
jgi:hypothetical protein